MAKPRFYLTQEEKKEEKKKTEEFIDKYANVGSLGMESGTILDMGAYLGYMIFGWPYEFYQGYKEGKKSGTKPSPLGEPSVTTHGGAGSGATGGTKTSDINSRIALENSYNITRDLLGMLDKYWAKGNVESFINSMEDRKERQLLLDYVTRVMKGDK